MKIISMLFYISNAQDCFSLERNCALLSHCAPANEQIHPKFCFHFCGFQCDVTTSCDTKMNWDVTSSRDAARNHDVTGISR